MSRWVFVGAALGVVTLIGVGGVLPLLPGTTRTDDRAYPGSSWSTTPDEVFTDFDITLPECTDGRMRYWAGSLEIYLRITAPTACVSQFVEANRMSTDQPLPNPPVLDKRETEFGWHPAADRLYTSHTRDEKPMSNVWTQAKSDNGTTDRSLYLHAWHQ